MEDSLDILPTSRINSILPILTEYLHAHSAKLKMVLYIIYFSTAYLHGFYGDTPFGLWIPQPLISILWKIGFNWLSLQGLICISQVDHHKFQIFATDLRWLVISCGFIGISLILKESLLISILSQSISIWSLWNISLLDILLFPSQWKNGSLAPHPGSKSTLIQLLEILSQLRLLYAEIITDISFIWYPSFPLPANQITWKITEKLLLSN